VAEQARRKHARVVDDQEVARLEKLRKRRDGGVHGVAGGTLKDEEPRPGAFRGGLLRD
jgi:hypothetical protein